MNYKEQITNRIIIILNDLYSGNKSKFGKKVGVDESRIRSYTLKNVDSRSMPSAEFVYSVVREIGINLEWLIFGDGEMFEKQTEIKIDVTRENRLLDIIESQQRTVESQQDSINELIKAKNNTAGDVLIAPSRQKK